MGFAIYVGVLRLCVVQLGLQQWTTFSEGDAGNVRSLEQQHVQQQGAGAAAENHEV